MTRKNFFIGLAACALLLCAAVPPQAGAFEPSVQPAFLQQAMKAAGIYAEIIDSDSLAGYPCCISIPDLKGSAVTIFFPKAGLRHGTLFLLDIDGMAACVRCSAGGEFEFVDGDMRIVNAGVFDLIGCILNTILDSVVALIEAIASLNILGILEAAFQLVFGILTCF
ncbi:MAG: hypothetical protein JW832_08105 [Deltaproteobacteria bacterium]|nr:hypothetical protein [Deltaproteobacteria bacterium]